MNGNPGIKVRTDAVRTAIILAVKEGMPKSLAAQAAGVSKKAFFDWVKDEPEFAEKLAEAKADYGKTLIKRALAIATEERHKDSAAMTQWLLERGFFEFFARKERVSNGGTGDPDDVAIEAATAPTLQPGGPDIEDLEAALREADTISAILRDALAGARAAAGPDAVPASEVHPAQAHAKTNGGASPHS